MLDTLFMSGAVIYSSMDSANFNPHKRLRQSSIFYKIKWIRASINIDYIVNIRGWLFPAKKAGKFREVYINYELSERLLMTNAL